MTQSESKNTIEMELGTHQACVKFRQERTPAGFRFKVALSALQKFIRRGMRIEALAVLKDLLDYIRVFPDTWSSDRDVKRVLTNVANRLVAMASEDVGPSQPGIGVATAEFLTTIGRRILRTFPAAYMTFAEQLLASRRCRVISDWKTVFMLPPYYLPVLYSEDQGRLLKHHNAVRAQFGMPELFGGDTQKDVEQFQKVLEDIVPAMEVPLEVAMSRVLEATSYYIWLYVTKDNVNLHSNKVSECHSPKTAVTLACKEIFSMLLEVAALWQDMISKEALDDIGGLHTMFKAMNHKEKPIYLYHALSVYVQSVLPASRARYEALVQDTHSKEATQGPWAWKLRTRPKSHNLYWDIDTSDSITETQQLTAMYEKHRVFVEDLHTKPYNTASASYTDFALKGAFVEPECQELFIPKYRAMYVALKVKLDEAENTEKASKASKALKASPASTSGQLSLQKKRGQDEGHGDEKMVQSGKSDEEDHGPKRQRVSPKQRTSPSLKPKRSTPSPRTSFQVPSEYARATKALSWWYGKVSNHPVAQLRTARHKKFIVVTADVVYKGPYHQEESAFQLALTRPHQFETLQAHWGLLEKYKSALKPARLIQLSEDPDAPALDARGAPGQWILVYVNVGRQWDRATLEKHCSIKATAVDAETNVLARGSFVNRVSDVDTKPGTGVSKDIQIAALYHLYTAWLLGCGDVGMYNMLVREDVHPRHQPRVLAGIDVEEYRGPVQPSALSNPLALLQKKTSKPRDVLYTPVLRELAKNPAAPFWQPLPPEFEADEGIKERYLQFQAALQVSGMECE